MKYVFKFRRRWFWTSLNVVGHAYDVGQDKMVVYFEGGSVREIAHWGQCEIQLGVDWVLAQKKSLEEQTGQTIPIRGVS